MMQLTFDPKVIQHLGFRMYARLPNALAELVANSYDADATRVTITVPRKTTGEVSVADDGHGMTESDLNEKYLIIGRNRTIENESESPSGRRAAGKKGLGKLAPFGVGNEISVATTVSGSNELITVTLNWKDLINSGGEYRPHVLREIARVDDQGTTITIRSLKRSSSISAEDLASSLSRLFNYTDKGFELEVKYPNSSPIYVTRDLRYKDLVTEASWRLPEDFGEELGALSDKISGRIYAAKSPLISDMRGVSIYVNGRLANDAEFYGVSESSYAASYLTGFVDANFVDDLPDDVISTDRRSISWETPETELLRSSLASVLRKSSVKWRDVRANIKKNDVSKELGTDVDLWTNSIKGPEASAVQQVLENLVSPDVQISDEDLQETVYRIKQIAPEYADLHWRHLHEDLREVSGEHYKAGFYHDAITEAIKRYVEEIKKSYDQPITEISAIEGAFTEKAGDPARPPRIDILRPWQPSLLDNVTQKNMRESQKKLSEAMWTGFRNPLQHELQHKLIKEGVFTYEDCLDALSILSYLYRRLRGGLDGER